MGQYSVEAVFATVDNMSGVIQGIGDMFSTVAAKFNGNADEIAQSADGIGVGAEVAEAGFTLLSKALEMGIQNFMETNDAMARMSAQTGMSVDSLGKYKLAAQAAFNSGLVSNMNDAAKAAQSIEQWISGLGDQKSINDFIVKAAGVASAWGISSSQVIVDVGKLQKKFKDLKDDPTKALDELTRAAQLTGIPFQDIANIVDKYGDKFAAAGLSSQESLGLITSAAQGAIGQKGMAGLSTAVDTFTANVANPNAAFKDGIKRLGLTDVVADLQKNKISMGDALQLIFNNLDSLKDPAQKSAVAIDLFGKGVMKIGGADAIGSLKDFQTAMGDVKGSAQQAADAMGTTWPVAVQGAENTIATSLGNIVQSAFDSAVQIGVTWELLWTDFPRVAGIWLKAVEDLWAPFFDWVVGRAKNYFTTLGNLITAALQPVLDIVNGIIAAIKAIPGALAGATAGGYSGGGSTGGSNGGNLGFHAQGGYLGAGWNVVGEEGMELVNGSTGLVVPLSGGAGSSMSSGGGSISAAPSGGGGGGTTYQVQVNGGTVIDMNSFMRQAYVAMQDEDLRRGKRS